MTDEFHIDSHKLIYHPRRLAEWLEADDDWQRLKKIYPIYIELSPFGGCNHRCQFCALDYLGYRPHVMDADLIEIRIPEMGKMGVKSIMFGGEGEPLLHKNIGRLTSVVHDSGIDLAITTNGVKLSEDYCLEHLDKLTWIKVSLNAGTPATYAQLHRTEPDDFSTVISNLRKAVIIRNRNNLACTIGAQLLLLPENSDEIETLAAICRDDIGLDYLVIKPYSHHRHSITEKYERIDYSAFDELGARTERFSSDRFKVIYRATTIAKHAKPKTYTICHSTPMFWAYVMANGDLYSCSAFLGDERFNLGNLHEQSFSEIWEGKRRQENIQLLQGEFDLHRCRDNCRMDSINHYLWELKSPHRHVNFI